MKFKDPNKMSEEEIIGSFEDLLVRMTEAFRNLED